MKIMIKKPPPKTLVEALIQEDSVFLHFDPRGEDVLVPDYLKRTPQLVLQFGYNLPIPIFDLTLSETHIEGTLSFNHSPFFCRIPWNKIFAIMLENGKGIVWDEYLPEELQDEVAREAGLAPPIQPNLKLLEQDSSPDETFDDDQNNNEKKEKPKLELVKNQKKKKNIPPYLKVIK